MANETRLGRFNGIMTRRSIDMRFWLKVGLAIIILLVIPLEFYYYEAIQPEPASNFFDIYYSSALFEYVNWMDRDAPPLAFSSLLTISAAIAICIPAILLNRRIRNSRSKETVRDSGLAAFFGTAVVTIFLLERFPPSEIGWLIPDVPDWRLIRFGSLVIVALIVLPLMMREVSHRGFKLKHRFLAWSIWLIATLVPAAIYVGSTINLANYQAISLTYYFWFEQSIPAAPWLPVDQINIAYNIAGIMDLFYSFTFLGFNLLFGFFVLRHLRGIESKRKVFLIGVASVLIPYLYATYLVGLGGFGSSAFVVPLPILFILGISLLARVKPVYIDPLEETVSEFTDIEESISVPVLYYLKSKMTTVFRRRKKSDSTSPE
ncbi:MAG: hypothetical protein ACXADF_13605 [Candidatus Thorarchaeota archaeon]